MNAGGSAREVAATVGVNRRTVEFWKQMYRQGGPAGIAARPTPGRPSFMRPSQRIALRAILERGARASGFPTDEWSNPRVAEVIRKRFGVHYDRDHIGFVVRSLTNNPWVRLRRKMDRERKAIRNSISKNLKRR